MCADSNQQQALPSSQQILAWILKATGVQATKQASDQEEALSPTTIIKAEKGKPIKEDSWLQLVNAVVSVVLNIEMNDELQKGIIEGLRNWDLAISKMNTCLGSKDRIITILRYFLPEFAARIGILAALVQPYSTSELPLSTRLCDLLNARIFGFTVEGLLVKYLPELTTWTQRYAKLKGLGIHQRTVEDWKSEALQVPNPQNIESLEKLIPDHFQQQAGHILRMARLLTRLQEDLRAWSDEEVLNQARKQFKYVAESVRDNYGDYLTNLSIIWNELAKQLPSDFQNSPYSFFARLIFSPQQILPFLSLLINGNWKNIFLFYEFSLFDRIQTELTLIYLAKEIVSEKEIPIFTKNCKHIWLPKNKEREIAQKLLKELQSIDPLSQEPQPTIEDSIIEFLSMLGFLFEKSPDEKSQLKEYAEYFAGIFNLIQIPSQMEPALDDEMVRKIPHIAMTRAERFASEGKYLDALDYISLIKDQNHKGIANFDRRCAQFFINWAHDKIDKLHELNKINKELKMINAPLTSEINKLSSKIVDQCIFFLNQADNVWFAPQNSPEELEKLSIMIPIAMRIDILSRSAQEFPDANSWPQAQRFGDRLESYQEISNGPACAVLALWQKEKRKSNTKILKKARRLGSADIYDREINRLRW